MPWQTLIAECKSKQTCKLCNRHHNTNICIRQENTDTNTWAKAKFQSNSNPFKCCQSTFYFIQIFSNSYIESCSRSTVHKWNRIPGTHHVWIGITAIIHQRKVGIPAPQLDFIGKEVLNFAGFGSTKTEVCQSDRVRIPVNEGINTYKPIDLLTVLHICVQIRFQTRACQSMWQFIWNWDLIGADHYWDFVMSHEVYGNEPTAVKSKPGYLLFGPAKENGRKTTMDIYKILYQHDKR